VERAALRNEFVATMQERFLKGEDLNFDYSAVDNNSEYDAVEMLNQDAEEKYFDEDEDDIDELGAEDQIASRSSDDMQTT